MDMAEKVLDAVREGIGLSTEPSAFDNELLMHINSGIGKLHQNGVTLPTVVTATTTWADIQDLTKTEGNEIFQMVPLFLMLNTKILFDPPPPSAVEHHSRQIDELLWRLKLAYE